MLNLKNFSIYNYYSGIPLCKINKINYLFALLDKLDPLMSVAPALVNRLKSLKQLHQEASVFSETINMLSNEQSKIREELKSLDDVSEKVCIYICQKYLFVT